MTDKTYKQKMAEAQTRIDKNMAIVEPFLRNFRAEYNQKHGEGYIGTCFCEDVTILSGPAQINYEYFQNKRRNLYEDWRKGGAFLYNVKYAGATFAIETKKVHAITAGASVQLFPTPMTVPERAFMVYENREYPVSLDIAKAVKSLYDAQEYMSIVHGAHLASMKR